MSLSQAKRADGSTLALQGDGPWPVSSLTALRDVAFSMPPLDPFVRGHADTAHSYLDAARESWIEHPEYMDFLDPESPIHELKLLERDLYLRDWAPALEGARTLLDLGCGVGRFTHWALAQGLDVHGVDADLRSLQRLLWRAKAWPGKLDLHWSSVHRLPDVRVDAVIACEVLCYVPEIDAAMQALSARLKPAGVLCLSVEARWGWVLAPDVSPGSVGHALLGEPILDFEGDNWVHTWERDELEALLKRHHFDVDTIIANHYVLDGPLERAAGEILDFDTLCDLEDAARHHPVYAPLHRIWSVIAHKSPSSS